MMMLSTDLEQVRVDSQAIVVMNGFVLVGILIWNINNLAKISLQFQPKQIETAKKEETDRKYVKIDKIGLFLHTQALNWV